MLIRRDDRFASCFLENAERINDIVPGYDSPPNHNEVDIFPGKIPVKIYYRIRCIHATYRGAGIRKAINPEIFSHHHTSKDRILPGRETLSNTQDPEPFLGEMHGSTYDRGFENNIPMSIDKDQVCILIPTLNESPTIGYVIQGYLHLGFSHILVIDGHSTDDTRQIAETAGASVILQQGKGKGTAIIEAFSRITLPFILMVDGDGTYLPEDAESIISPLLQGADQVIGDRLIPENRTSFSRMNYFGNQILNRLFKVAHGRYLNDILSGYRAFRLDSIRQMQLHESGFGIETEISAEAVRNGHTIQIVPIAYRKRMGTQTKLNPFHDGLKISTTIYRLAKMSNPLFYFGLIGMIIFCGGLITGIYVIYEWLQQIEHIPLTIFTVLLIIAGFQIFMFGILSDMSISLHREVMREIQSLKEGKDQKK